MIPIKNYIKVYNKCCLIYLGNSINILNEIIAKAQKYQILYPKIEIYICCQDQLFNEGYNKLIKKSNLINLNDFCYIKEIMGSTI